MTLVVSMILFSVDGKKMSTGWWITGKVFFFIGGLGGCVYLLFFMGSLVKKVPGNYVVFVLFILVAVDGNMLLDDMGLLHVSVLSLTSQLFVTMIFFVYATQNMEFKFLNALGYGALATLCSVGFSLMYSVSNLYIMVIFISVFYTLYLVV